MQDLTVIRVGEKNNFNHSQAEFDELKKYESKGKIFVNSNSFNPVRSDYPSFITINPYMTFQPIMGDLSNVKAVRIKFFRNSDQEIRLDLLKCLKFCIDNNLPILLTYMRYRSKNTATKYSGENYRDFYEWKKNYFRPTQESKTFMKEYVQGVLSCENKEYLFNECDGSGGGCPDCMNCTKLSYGLESATIKALNLSVSGIKDKHGRKGLCPYNCPDCFAKIVTFGKRPQCDKLITNKKIDGKLKA